MENNIQVKTSHGIRHVSTKDIIHFHEGLLGFKEYNDFVIYDIEGCEPFKSMLSVEKGGPDFVVVEPMVLFEDYSPLVIFDSSGKLDIGDPVKLVVLSIVTLAEKPEDITVNLRGPLFINLSSRQAKQVILPDERYQTQMPLLINE